MLKIEQFVEEQFGIKLLPAQIEMIAMIAANPDIEVLITPIGKKTGKTTAVKAALAYLQDGLKEVPTTAPVTNQSGQPIGDFPKDIPTDEDFERMHSEPVSYGDEDDWVLISKKYTQEEALAKIQELMKKDWGWSEDEGGYPTDVNDLQTFDVGYGYDHDSYHYSEGGYWICSESNQVSKRWEAWGVATQ